MMLVGMALGVGAYLYRHINLPHCMPAELCSYMAKKRHNMLPESRPDHFGLREWAATAAALACAVLTVVMPKSLILPSWLELRRSQHRSSPPLSSTQIASFPSLFTCSVHIRLPSSARLTIYPRPYLSGSLQMGQINAELPAPHSSGLGRCSSASRYGS